MKESEKSTIFIVERGTNVIKKDCTTEIIQFHYTIDTLTIFSRNGDIIIYEVEPEKKYYLPYKNEIIYYRNSKVEHSKTCLCGSVIIFTSNNQNFEHIKN